MPTEGLQGAMPTDGNAIHELENPGPKETSSALEARVSDVEDRIQEAARRDSDTHAAAESLKAAVEASAWG